MGKQKIAAKDVVVEYLTGGLEAVEAFDKAHGPLSRNVLRTAMRLLEEKEKTFTDLDKWCRKQHGFGLNNRAGLRAPKVGEQRRYKVQIGRGSGGPFMKLPLATLKVDGDSYVKGLFEDGRIIIVAD